jgi:hypothetical protein
VRKRAAARLLHQALVCGVEVPVDWFLIERFDMLVSYKFAIPLADARQLYDFTDGSFVDTDTENPSIVVPADLPGGHGTNRLGAGMRSHLDDFQEERTDCSHGGSYCAESGPGEIDIPGPIALNVTHPLPGAQTLEDLPIFVEILITDFDALPEDWAERFEICVKLSSDHFPTKEFGCLPLSTPELRVSSIPYGRHVLHVYINHQTLGIVVDTMNVIPIITVPIVWPRDVPPPDRGSCFDGVGPMLLDVPAKHPVPKLDLWGGPHDAIATATTMATAAAALLPITVCVLVHRGAKSLEVAAASWMANGLLGMVAERVIFVQELDYEYAADDTFATATPRVAADEQNPKFQRLRRVFDPRTNVTVIPSPNQVHITGGMAALVENAESEFVLFLEEDWKLLESPDVVRRQLEEGVQLIQSKTIDVLRMRHRANPGHPMCALRWSGKEVRMQQHSNHSVLDSLHWLDDPSEFFDHGTVDRVGSVFRTTSPFAGWTNNPTLFSRDWFMCNLAPIAAVDGTGRLEVAVNEMPQAWDDRHFLVGQGQGLFQHNDLDQDARVQSPCPSWW